MSWRNRLSMLRLVLALLVAIHFTASAQGTLIWPTSGRTAKSGPDGGGGIPRTTGPSAPTTPFKPWVGDAYVPTYTVVCDAVTGAPLAGELVVVTLPGEGLVAQGVTNSEGRVVLMLKNVPGHELALPALGVGGLAIDPGEVLLVLVP